MLIDFVTQTIKVILLDEGGNYDKKVRNQKFCVGGFQ